jgi:hypothetical protein
MQHTPFMIDTGRHPHMGFKPHQARLKLESVNEFTDKMAEGLEEMKAALVKAKDKYTNVLQQVDMSQPPSLPQVTRYDSMEAVSRPTDHRQNCLTVNFVL